MVGALEIQLDAGEPIAGDHVVAGLTAEDRPAQLGGRSIRRLQRIAGRGIAEQRIGIGAAAAVADIEPGVEACPGPRRHQYCVLRDQHGRVSFKRIELVVQSGADQLIGDMRVELCGQRHVLLIG